MTTTALPTNITHRLEFRCETFGKGPIATAIYATESLLGDRKHIFQSYDWDDCPARSVVKDELVHSPSPICSPTETACWFKDQMRKAPKDERVFVVLRRKHRMYIYAAELIGGSVTIRWNPIDEAVHNGSTAEIAMDGTVKGRVGKWFASPEDAVAYAEELATDDLRSMEGDWEDWHYWAKGTLEEHDKLLAAIRAARANS